MGLLELLWRIASFVMKSKDSDSRRGFRAIEAGWEVMHTEEYQLFPSRLTAEDGSVKYDQGVGVIASVLELDASKTWVLVRRGEEDHVLAWSPCDGERAMIPADHLSKGAAGLLLAEGTSHLVELTVDYNAQALYVVRKDQVYSSLTNSWQPLPDEDEAEAEVGIPELGKTYMRYSNYNPRLNLRRPIPLPEALKMSVGARVRVHWYKGSLYALGNDYAEGMFRLFVWDDEHQERGWQELDSHPMFCHGVQRPGGDRFFVSAGARYFCTIQVHEEELDMSGRFMVVYDLEERKWHYRTIRDYGFPTALVCTRGRCNNVLDLAFTAVWTDNLDLLQLPPPA